MRHHRDKGFTLIELLVVLGIIGTLATMAVVSYESVRTNSRDTKRVSDVKQIQVAVELYFESHGTYPYDGVPGTDGLLLGLGETKTLSDAGFSPSVEGTPYMVNVPRNPTPGGVEYVYRSLDRDGRDCDDERGCDAYALLFVLESGTGAYEPGPHAVTPAGAVGAGGGFAGRGVVGPGGELTGLSSTQRTIARYAEGITYVVRGFVGDSRVEAAANVAAPVAAVTAVANVATSTQSASALGYFFLSFLTQPLILFRNRRRDSWGIVYDAMTKLPVDLAIVRLRDAVSGKVVKSTVTDVEGRFSLLVRTGAYRIEVAKEGVRFPSDYVEGKVDDGYEDVYRGEVVNVTKDGALLTPSIPVDPVVPMRDDEQEIARARRKGRRRNLAVIGPAVAVVTFAVAPSAFTGTLFALQLLTYLAFMRIAKAAVPAKNWGVVYEKGTGKPVSHAVLRIFESKYNKLLESQVSDRSGRYHFRVGNNSYFLTASKPGYEKTESEPLDLTKSTGPTVISANIPLRPKAGGDGAAKTTPRKRRLIGPHGEAPEAGPGNDGTAEEDDAGSPTPEHELPSDLVALRAATRPATSSRGPFGDDGDAAGSTPSPKGDERRF